MNELVAVVLAILLMISAVTRETYVLVLGYLIAGTFLIGRWWPRHTLSHLQVNRNFVDHVFPGETINVDIKLVNKSFLPAIWLSIRDLHPIDLAEIHAFRQVTSLLPKQSMHISYQLKARKRGYYPVGPMTMETGDILGWVDQLHANLSADHVTVYPRVIPLAHPRPPSNSPLGTLRHQQPLFEDPSRPVGKRDYQPGDALKRVDWKSTASSGKLQVKLFEPSIDLETAIFLDLSTEGYNAKSRFFGPELSIVAAASLANWAVRQRLPVGIISNGIDLFNQTGEVQPILPKKGRAHLMRVLEYLARIKDTTESVMSLHEMINHYRHDLGWGTSLFVITGSINNHLVHAMHAAQRAGLQPFLIMCGWLIELPAPVRNGRIYDIPIRMIHKEEELKTL